MSIKPKFKALILLWGLLCISGGCNVKCPPGTNTNNPLAEALLASFYKLPVAPAHPDSPTNIDRQRQYFSYDSRLVVISEEGLYEDQCGGSLPNYIKRYYPDKVRLLDTTLNAPIAELISDLDDRVLVEFVQSIKFDSIRAIRRRHNFGLVTIVASIYQNEYSAIVALEEPEGPFRGRTYYELYRDPNAGWRVVNDYRCKL